MEKLKQHWLKGATVSVFEKSQLIKVGITDSDGFFEISNLKAGEFNVKVTCVGFKEAAKDITVKADDNSTIFILMEPAGESLANVTIISKVPPVGQKDDTTQYSAKEYKVNPDATSEDLIKKMPGITVDKSGTVTAHGEQVKKVTVDGKDFFGDDATSALKNLPASVVDKIQVFDKLSDQAQLTGIDDGNSQKTINIITKAGIQNAQFGRIYAGGGNDSKYSGGGNLSFFKNERRVSVVGNFNNINQQNFGSQDLLGITGSNNNNQSRMGMSSGRGPGGSSSESFTVGPSSGISTTNAAGLNYNDKWGKFTTITGSYFFNNSINDNTSITNTRILEGGQTTYQQSDARAVNNNHRINARVEIKLDSSNMLFIIPNLSFQTNNTDKFTGLKSYIQPDDSLYNSHSNTSNDKNGYNLRNNIMYRHTFKKKGRIFSAGWNTVLTKNDGNSLIDGVYRFYDNATFPLPTDSIQQQDGFNNTNSYTLSGNLSYNEPLDKEGKSQLQFEYNPSFQRSHADQQTFTNKGLPFKSFDTTLSNLFDNDILTHNGGVTYRISPSKDEQFAVGVSYQQTALNSNRLFPTKTNVDQTFRNFLPNAYWRKKLSKQANVRFFYRASTNFPSINQLQDVVNLSNPVNVSSGNKDLQQSYTHYLGGRYTYTNNKTGRSWFGGFFMQVASAYISNATYILQQDSMIAHDIVLKKGTQLNKPVNLDGYQSLRSNLTYSFPLKFIKSNISLNANLNYSQLPGLVNYVNTTTKTYQYSLGTVLSSNISEYVDYNINYMANINLTQTSGATVSNNNYVNHNLTATLNLLSKKGWFVSNELNYQRFQGLTGGFNQTFTLWNAAIGKKFMKSKAAEFKISCFDILKQNQSISRNITSTYIEDAQSKVLSRYFMATFSYNLKNFGKAKKAATKEEEFIQPVGYPSRY